jgi:hypothetical protein
MIKHNIEEEAKLMLYLNLGYSRWGYRHSCILTILRISNKYLKPLYDYIMEHSYADEDDRKKRILEEGVKDARENTEEATTKVKLKKICPQKKVLPFIPQIL